MECENLPLKSAAAGSSFPTSSSRVIAETFLSRNRSANSSSLIEVKGFIRSAKLFCRSWVHYHISTVKKANQSMISSSYNAAFTLKYKKKICASCNFTDIEAGEMICVIAAFPGLTATNRKRICHNLKACLQIKNVSKSQRVFLKTVFNWRQR